ncbi:unnamed protein product [Lepeophtheirus salmonis]|uniref:(salmon louse) hypothetical protein n=1 Tax=Lepeophtheirus salmonis TaxID=72036 RepID=A0A7R8D373_LEPSM|nr:unnamed protein product [Lepeophtheirus salmonis]CAF3013887.1 unnamed protein product [Lepeophtheirus salmonis]
MNQTFNSYENQLQARRNKNAHSVFFPSSPGREVCGDKPESPLTVGPSVLFKDSRKIPNLANAFTLVNKSLFSSHCSSPATDMHERVILLISRLCSCLCCKYLFSARDTPPLQKPIHSLVLSAPPVPPFRPRYQLGIVALCLLRCPCYMHSSFTKPSFSLDILYSKAYQLGLHRQSIDLPTPNSLSKPFRNRLFKLSIIDIRDLCECSFSSPLGSACLLSLTHCRSVSRSTLPVPHSCFLPVPASLPGFAERGLGNSSRHPLPFRYCLH